MPKFQSIFSTKKELSWSRQKDFASTAYALEIALINGSICKEDNRTRNSLLHLEANNISRTASTAPIVTTSSTSTHKKQAVKQRMFSDQIFADLQLKASVQLHLNQFQLSKVWFLSCFHKIFFKMPFING